MMNEFLKRLLYAVPVVLGVTVIVFLSMALIPGDPAQAILGPYATPENIERINRELGLNQPLAERYFIWLGNLLQGDFGRSYSLNRPVFAEILDRIAPTLLLASTSLGIASLFGIGAGILAAVYQFGWQDRLSTLLVLVGISLPSFWLALIAVLLFAVFLPWFPVSGMVSVYEGGGILDVARHLFLPSVVLATVAAGVLGRLTKAAMLEVLRQDFIRSVRAHGISERRVIFLHAVKNALTGLVPVIALQFGFLLGGAVYVESVFQWPGIGRMLVSAINSRDILLVQGSVLLLALLYVGLNLAADLLQKYLDPRLR